MASWMAGLLPGSALLLVLCAWQRAVPLPFWTLPLTCKRFNGHLTDSGGLRPFWLAMTTSY